MQRNMVKRTYLILWIIILFTCTKAYGDNPFYVVTLAEFGLAKASGFNQIPRGGSQNSSSYRRPNFGELGIHHETYHTLGIGAQYHSWQMLYSHAAIHFEKSAILNEALLSHGKTLPVDLLYHFNIAVNKHQIQFKKQFFSLPKNNNFHFALLGNFDWLGYHYNFYPIDSQTSASTPSSNRDFINFSCSLGSEFMYQWHPYFSSILSLSTSFPSFHLRISEAKLIQRFHPFNRYLSKLTPYVGISYFKIDLQDNQGLANHLRFTAKPYFFTGIEFLLI